MEISKFVSGPAAALALSLFVIIPALSGCSGDKNFTRTPPAGMGSLVVDNQTPDDIDVFVDGALALSVRDRDDDFVDLDPGLHRVVISEQGGDRSYFDELDVLAARLTVLRVFRGRGSAYDVTVSIENP